MMEVMPVASQPIYQFYAELKDYKPLIWRRFQVAGNITLAQLGYVTMTLFEMKGSHLSVSYTHLDVYKRQAYHGWPA